MPIEINLDKPTLIVIHGGNSYNSEEDFQKTVRSYPPRFRDNYRDWKSFLNENLHHRFNVLQPQMPRKDFAKFTDWEYTFNRILDIVPVPSKIYLVGHSLGSIFLQRFLAEHTLDHHVEQLHLVTPHLDEGNFTISSNWQNITRQCSQIHLWHSSDDPYVPLEQAKTYHQNLPNSNFHLYHDRKHFTGSSFPEIISILIQNKF